MQIGTSHRLELPTHLRSKLEAYRRRVWIVKLAEGILAGVVGLVASYLLVFLLDRFWDTPAEFRLLLLLTGTVGLALWLPLKWHRWVWNTRRLEQAARLLQHRFPGIGDQLLGIVELAHSELEQERSESLCRAAMRQVDEEVRDCDFRGAVPRPRHRHWGWTAGVLLVLSAALLVIVPDAGTNALARWLFPWRDTQRYTFAQLASLPNQLVVPYAESFPVGARLAPGSPWKPEHGWAQYGRQQPMRAALTSQGYLFSLPPQKKRDTLTISVGDARKHIRVAPTSRPELTEITATVTLPSYLQYSSRLEQDVRSGSLSVVAGSRVAVTAVASRTLREATLSGRRLHVTKNRFVVPETLIDRAARWDLRWSDELGLSAKDPFHFRVAALRDEAPRVSCAKLPRQQVVLSTETISFEVSATDDFGIKLIGIEWNGIEDPLRNPHPASGRRKVAAGAPERQKLKVTAALSTQREGIKPQSLEIRLFALDYLPGRKPVYSPKYVFHVLSPEEHAIWLTNQMRKWYQRANEVYEREQQLHAENKALRALSAEQLDQPDTRRRIETQAASERANARQLAALNQTGEQLVKQAARNEQFNVQTLETWAEMLQLLKDIAEKRMPSVADLLAEAADAPGADRNKSVRGNQRAGKTSPQTGVNRDARTGPAGETKRKKEAQPVPSVSDVESGFNELENSKKSSSGSGRSSFGLPSTDIMGGGAKQEDDDGESTPARAKVDEAVIEQADLLAEFSKVARELQKIIADLEGSTFVKRLKAASRHQLDVAAELNRSVAADFGVSHARIGEQEQQRLARMARRETGYGDQVYVIQDDLEAYFNRIQDGKFLTVLNEMKSVQVVGNLQKIAESLEDNLTGQSIAEAEYWADALDRWAEQLVGPG